MLKVYLAQPRGFCAGVVRAVETVEQALRRHGPPVYVRHEIVHNRHVVEALEFRGARFVESLDEIPEGGVTIFSAHGVPQSVEEEARRRDLPTIDATCPLVTKVHRQGRRYLEQGRALLLIGHAGHQEVIGTIGQVNGPVHLIGRAEDVADLPLTRDTPVAYVTQTTLSIDDTEQIIEAIQKRFDDVVGPSTSDICYATQNRQSAVRQLAAVSDLLLVVGATNSSNSNRLCEIGEEAGLPSYLIAEASAIDPAWLAGVRAVGVTAGASAPEVLIEGVIEELGRLAEIDLATLPGPEESIDFRLPRALTA